MSYSIIPTDKKYPSLKKELSDLNINLLKDPSSGTSLGNNTYKIRIAIKSKVMGKSGGARVITYLITENKEVYLLTIYDKADFDSIDDKAIKNIIKHLNSGQ